MKLLVEPLTLKQGENMYFDKAILKKQTIKIGEIYPF